MQGDVREAVSRHRWWIILAIVVMFGYSIGKGLAWNKILPLWGRWQREALTEGA